MTRGQRLVCCSANVVRMLPLKLSMLAVLALALIAAACEGASPDDSRASIGRVVVDSWGGQFQADQSSILF